MTEALNVTIQRQLFQSLVARGSIYNLEQMRKTDLSHPHISVHSGTQRGKEEASSMAT